jgi:hypothetical protein
VSASTVASRSLACEALHLSVSEAGLSRATNGLWPRGDTSRRRHRAVLSSAGRVHPMARHYHCQTWAAGGRISGRLFLGVVLLCRRRAPTRRGHADTSGGWPNRQAVVYRPPALFAATPPLVLPLSRRHDAGAANFRARPKTNQLGRAAVERATALFSLTSAGPSGTECAVLQRRQSRSRPNSNPHPSVGQRTLTAASLAGATAV